MSTSPGPAGRIGAADVVEVAFEVNSKPRTARTEPRTSLADVLRHELGLYGVRVGCEHGICGACTVLIDGVPARSCLTLAVQADGSRISTVEGLAQADGQLSALQASFHRHYALQCGFCTAGILISATWAIEQGKASDEHAVRDLLSGHLCRCTGYAPIVDAILDAAGSLVANASNTPQKKDTTP
jgi:2-furoyl-CoA dehydrogenase 2Fe-2S iron sulfur subunit